MSAYAGTALLTRTALRRDRVIIPIWLYALAFLVYASASATPKLFKTTAERVAAATQINADGATVALYGPINDVHSVGELSMAKATVLFSIFVAALFVVLVMRHTRREEESGRLELVGGTAVGAAAPATAALVEAAGIAVAAGALGMLAAIVGGLPATGALAFGATWTGIGLVTIGITTLAAQLAASARTCTAITAGALGVLYVLRAVGDTSSAARWLSWASPFGWNTQVHAWSQPRWWVLALYVGLAAVLLGVAAVLRARRDLGSGMIAARPGAAVGSPRLADALALCLRLNAGVLVTWTVAAAAIGVVFGAIAPGFDAVLGSGNARDMIARVGGGGAIADALVAAMLSMIAIVHTYFAITVLSRAGGDESDGRAEEVLATGTSRAGWYFSTVTVALGGTLWLLLVTGAFLWLGFGATSSASQAAGAHPWQIVPGALAWTPAVWLVAAIGAGLLALRKVGLGWALPALCLIITIVGELFEAPSLVQDISPYSHIGLMPSESFRATPTIVLLVLTALVLGGSWRWFARRDIG